MIYWQLFAGADTKGHPTIGLKDCDAIIGKIRMKFYCRNWFIYKKLIKFFDNYLKKEFAKLVRIYFTQILTVILAVRIKQYSGGWQHKYEVLENVVIFEIALRKKR